MAPTEESFEFEFTDDDSIEVKELTNQATEAIPAPVTLEKTPETEIPDLPETPVPDPPKPEAPKEQEIDLKGYSEAAKYALSYQKTDKVLPEDMEIKKDLTMVELKALLKEAAARERDAETEKYLEEREEAEKARLNSKGLTDSHLTYIQQIINGGDPQVVSRVAQYRSWADAELETEEENEAAVRAGLMIKYGNGDDARKMIDSYIKNDLKDSQALATAAQEQQEYIGQVATYMEQQDAQRIQNAKAAQAEAKKAFEQDIEKQIKEGFYGLKLSKQDQIALKEYMTKETETIDTPTGRIKVTKEEFDRRKDAVDMAKRVFEANARRTGYDKVVNKLVDVANTTATDKYLEQIRKIEEQPETSTVKSGTEVFELEI